MSRRATLSVDYIYAYYVFRLTGWWRQSSHPATVYQIPDSTRCCSESIGYVRMGCPTSVQTTLIRRQLCNYCATRTSAVYHADVRPSRALTMEDLADLRSSDASA